MHQGGLLFKEDKSSEGLLSGTKVVFFFGLIFMKLGLTEKLGTLDM